MSGKIVDLSEDEHDMILCKIMMTKREIILSTFPTLQRRTALTNSFDRAAAKFDENAADWDHVS